MLTQKELKELVHYDPNTGAVTWKVNKGRGKKGNPVGSLCKSKGYFSLATRINRVNYKVHNLIYLYVVGSYPPKGFVLDHIDVNSLNNKWHNLRLVTEEQNRRNRKVSVRNKSRVVGISWNKSRGKWEATIMVDGKNKRLLASTDFFEVVCARKSAEVKYNYGRFID